jgi:hypothetical protein
MKLKKYLEVYLPNYVNEKNLYIDGNKTTYIVCSNGEIYSTVYQNHIRKIPHKMIGGIDTDGYRHLTLTIGKNKYTKKVHRLVAITFIPIPKRYTKIGLSYDDLTVNHLDGDKLNNDVSNLAWCTSAENTEHAIKMGLRHNRKIKELVNDICVLIESNNYSFSEIADMLVTRVWFVKKIYKKDAWKSISDNYDFSKYIPEDHNETVFEIRKPSFDEDEAEVLSKLIESNKYSLIELSRIFSVEKYDVLKLFHGKLYPEISSKYNFDNYIKRQSIYFK